MAPFSKSGEEGRSVRCDGSWKRQRRRMSAKYKRIKTYRRNGSWELLPNKVIHLYKIFLSQRSYSLIVEAVNSLPVGNTSTFRQSRHFSREKIQCESFRCVTVHVVLKGECWVFSSVSFCLPMMEVPRDEVGNGELEPSY